MKTNVFENKVVLELKCYAATSCMDDYGDGDTCGECSSN